MGSDEEEREIYENELKRIMDSLDRYNQCDPEEVEEDEYEALYARFGALRRAGFGPQPHHLDD